MPGHDLEPIRPQRVEAPKPGTTMEKIKNQTSFFSRSRIGRFLSGQNKAGQAFQIVLQVALSFTPFKKLSEARGHITDILEAKESGFSVPDLNLTDRQIQFVQWTALVMIPVIIMSILLGWIDLERLIEVVRSIGGALGYVWIAGFAGFMFVAQQGQVFRVIAPDPPSNKRFGQSDLPDHYYSKKRHSDGSVTECRDRYGSIVQASEHIPYPRGNSDGYRHVDYITEHENRFELIEDQT